MTTTETAAQARVQQLVQQQLEAGDQIGVQVAAYHHGKPIVEVSAGQLGPGDPRPVQPDSLFSSFSTTKGVAATALHILADRGIIDYDAPVSTYWPEFGQHGKDHVTVAQAMSHQAGLHYLPRPLTTEFVTDWEGGLRYIADGVPAWEPGTATGYHALTFAWIVGGIIQYATGRHIRDFVEEEIARPLGVSGEMYIGIPDGLESRLATLEERDRSGANRQIPIPDDHDFFKAMPPDQEFSFNDMAIRKCCLPSANGHFTARALARMYGALANGGEVDGVRLVSPERIPHMYRLMTDAPDRVVIAPLRKGIGFFLGSKQPSLAFAFGTRETAFGHPGAGGSVAYADPEVGLSIAVTNNKMQATLGGPGPTYDLCQAIRQELGVP